jgi:F-type H+-transporting ATPase subunit epsilon
MSGTFHVTVVTPEREVLAVEAKFVAFPAFDGEMGILARRAPLLAKLGAGLLRVDEAAGGKRRLFIAGGFAQMVDNRLTVLTEEAVEPEKVTAELARRALAEAAKLPHRTQAESDRRAKAESRARAIAHLAKA